MTNKKLITEVKFINNNNGYAHVKKGVYKVKHLVPRLITPNFTFSRYVTIELENGDEVSGYAYRFETLSGQSCEDYIRENIADGREH